MQALAGILFVAALVLAVVFGGQTLDYSWGPALLLLCPALLVLLGGVRQLRERGWGTWLSTLLLAVAAGWILYGCAHSPVKQFARSDSLLIAGATLCFLYGLLLPPGGKGARIFMAGLSLLGIANGIVVLLQTADPSFSWPFNARPSTFPSGFFGHYNHLADFASAGSAFLAARAIFSRDSIFERIFQGIGVVFFFICIACANSRGAFVGYAAAAEVLSIAAFLVALRNASKWRGLLAILPVLLLVVGSIPAWMMIKSFENARGVDEVNATGLADNRLRLVLMGVGLRISADHPLTGGGSRSFGWQKYAAWNDDPTAQDGKLPTNDDFTHNEVLQTAVDYGWVGAGLVILAVMTTGLTGIGGLLLKDEHGREPRHAADATAVGGLAALTATLVNSNFSFVTYTLPGAMYLGLALAFALPRRTPPPAAYVRRVLSAIPVSLVSVGTAVTAFIVAITATRAFIIAWPVGNTTLSVVEPNAAADRLEKAAGMWPDSNLWNAAGQLCQGAAGRGVVDKSEIAPLLQRADGFYRHASELYPYSPVFPFNRANVLVSLSKDDPAGPIADEAEKTFEQALRLQGGMEGLLRVRYFYAQFLSYRWDVLWRKNRRGEEALGKFIYARQLLQQSQKMTELWVQLNDVTNLLTQLDQKIEYMEGAGIRPAAAEGAEEQ